MVDPVYTDSVDFDWQSMKHNRVQVEIEVGSLAKSILVSTDGRNNFCVDTSSTGSRVGAFNNGDLTAYCPIQVGVHKIAATPYADMTALRVRVQCQLSQAGRELRRCHCRESVHARLPDWICLSGQAASRTLSAGHGRFVHGLGLSCTRHPTRALPPQGSNNQVVTTQEGILGGWQRTRLQGCP